MDRLERLFGPEEFANLPALIGKDESGTLLLLVIEMALRSNRNHVADRGYASLTDDEVIAAFEAKCRELSE